MKSKIVLLVGILLVLLPVFAQAFTGTGSGTEEDPYIITNVYELQEMNEDLDAWYELSNDINASETVNWNEGEGFVPIADVREDSILYHSFNGHFDGKGYIITGLSITNIVSYIGLFGCAGPESEIKNLGLRNANIIGQDVSIYFVGILVGYNQGTITNCYSKGSVTGYGHTGGLIGSNDGLVTKCYSTASVDGLGGLIGSNYGVVTNCYSTGSVFSSWFAVHAGFIGYNHWNGVVTNCYSTGSVDGDWMRGYGGGFIGGNDENCNQCFWDIETSGWDTSAGGVGKTTAEMKQQSTFTGWDFEIIWDIVEGQTYPFLREVGPSLLADAGPDRVVFSGDTVSFDTFNPSDPEGIELSYQWDFKDGETASGLQVIHCFRGAMNEPKVYHVVLTVRDAQGTIATDTAEITVYPREKPVEVEGLGYKAGMTALYNWVKVDESGEDVYIISKITSFSALFRGGCEVSIFDGGTGLSMWRDIYISHDWFQERTWNGETQFKTTKRIGKDCPITLLAFPEDAVEPIEVFEGIEVCGKDEMNIDVIGPTVGITLKPSMIFDEAKTKFDPGAPVESLSPWAMRYFDLLVAFAFSPVELRVYDSQGNVTGLVDGEVREEIPNSDYDNETNTVVILYPAEPSYYEVVGTDVGTDDGMYEVDIISVENSEATAFTGTDIPVLSNAVHRYTMDWEALSQGEEGVTLQIDADGDSVFERTIMSDNELTGEELTVAVEEQEKESNIPKAFALFQNYPNPFNPTTKIAFSLPKNSYVTLTIFNVLGQKVTILVNGLRQTGNHQVIFNGANFSNGIYFYCLKTRGFSKTMKMLLIR